MVWRECRQIPEQRPAGQDPVLRPSDEWPLRARHLPEIHRCRLQQEPGYKLHGNDSPAAVCYGVAQTVGAAVKSGSVAAFFAAAELKSVCESSEAFSLPTDIR